MKMEENALAIDIHTQNVYKMIKCRYAKGTKEWVRETAQHQHHTHIQGQKKVWGWEAAETEQNERREKSSLILIDVKLSTAWIFIYIWYCFERYSVL